MPLIDEIRAYQQAIFRICDERDHFRRYRLNSFWQNENRLNIESMLTSSSDTRALIRKAQLTNLYQINSTHPSQKLGVEYLHDVLLRQYGQEFRDAAAYADGEIAPPELTAQVAGRRFSLDVFRYISSALNIRQHIAPQRGGRFFELGAGLGGLARILCGMFEPSLYVICDIPHSIIFSWAFLSSVLPGYEIITIDDESQLPGVLKEGGSRRIVFVPTPFIDAVKGEEFDLFVNTASLGEMHVETIRFWYNFFQNRNSFKAVYFLNRYLNVYVPGIMNDWRLDENEASVHFDENWNIRSWALDPVFLKCPFVFTHHSRMVEIIAERDQPKPAFSGEDEALDWIDALDVFSGEFPLSNPILRFQAVNNSTHFGMGGPLHRIWDAVRMFPRSERLIDRLIRLLALYRGQEEWRFEEEPYYLSLYHRLKTKN